MQALQQQAGAADDGAVQAWDCHFIDELTVRHARMCHRLAHPPSPKVPVMACAVAQSLGVAQADVRKLKDAGMHTVEGVLIKSKREFNEIKGIRSACCSFGHCQC